MNNHRYCVIMCGGVGSRFWPYSRQDKPKQFLDFLGTGRSLLQMSVDRIEGIVQPQNIYMLTNEQYAPIIREQFPDMRPEQILLEPCRRNTAPCIAWAAYHIHALDPEAQIMVAPSDHLVLKADRFRDSVLKAFEFIERTDAILTLGIKPHRPETGYGYIQVGDHVGGDFSAVKTFTEKPNAELAQVFLQSGEFYWNSGMFFWSAQCIIESIRSFAPDIAQKLDPGMGIYGTPGEKAFIEQNFPSCPSISIDFAVMEKAPNVYVECVDIGWSDLGTWGSLYEISPKNVDGNVTQRCKALMVNSRGNIVAVEGDKVVVASGLNDFIIADADDVLLIVPREEEQKIKLYVNEVKSKFGEQYL
ncbi:MAG TPA: mannose-1-phosphate guanylyltransferase [Porphyromonadaceae bacterium]|nr:mannose-1-phosphate guanylyltransferase [Porphyromonadaceae bacterium]